MSVDVEAVIEEAKSDFTLNDRLRNKKLRTGTVTVFTDDELGERHLAAELELNRLEAAKSAAGDEFTGDKLLAKAKKEHAALTAELKKSRVTLHLQVVPDVFLEDSEGVAKRHLKIKGDVPEERRAEVDRVKQAYLLQRATTKLEDHFDGEVFPTISLETAVLLRTNLPPHERLKVDVKLGELQYANTISTTVTNDPDF